MPITQSRGRQIKDDDVGREDINVTEVGRALIRKLLAGTDIGITYTGADSGTGDVTVNLSYAPRTANLFLASPVNSTGAPVFRAIAFSDLPSITLDSLSNTNISANSNGEILRWNGSAWINNTLDEASIVSINTTQTITGVKTFSGSGKIASFGLNGNNPNAVIATQTNYIQIVSGGATQSMGLIFHNAGISTNALEYVNTDTNTGFFNFKSDDSTWNVRINNNQVWHSGNLINPTTGTGTTNYLPKFTGSSTLINSSIFDSGTYVGISTGNPTEKLDVSGNVKAISFIGSGSSLTGVTKVTDFVRNNYVPNTISYTKPASTGVSWIKVATLGGWVSIAPQDFYITINGDNTHSDDLITLSTSSYSMGASITITNGVRYNTSKLLEVIVNQTAGNVVELWIKVNNNTLPASISIRHKDLTPTTIVEVTAEPTWDAIKTSATTSVAKKNTRNVIYNKGVEAPLFYSEGTGPTHGYNLIRTSFDSYGIRHNDGGFTILNITDNRKELQFDGTGLATFGGNVKIGASTSSYKLNIGDNLASDVTGLFISNSRPYGSGQGTWGASIFLGKTEGVNNQPMFALTGRPNTETSSAEGYGIISTRTGSVLTEKIRITSLGTVGIGTTNPNNIGGHENVLTLYGSNATALVLQDAVGRKDIRLNDGNLSITNSSGNTHFYVSNTGSVSINNNDPKALIDIRGTSGMLFNIRHSGPVYNIASDVTLGVLGFSNIANNSNITKAFGVRISKTSASVALNDVKLHIDLLREFSFSSSTEYSLLETGKVTAVTLDGVGNVGIGTTSPNSILSILKSSTVNLEHSGGIEIASGVANTNAKLIFGTVGDSYSYIQSMQRGTSWTSRPLVLMPNGGNLSIATTSTFSTGGNARISVQMDNSQPLSLGSSNTDLIYIRKMGVGIWEFQTTVSGGNSGNLLLQPYGGNLGIGTTSPQVKFSVKSSQNNTILPANAVAKFMGGDAGIFLGTLAGSPTYGAWIQSMRESDSYIFPLLLQPIGGNVGIGNTSPGEKLDVSGNIKSSGDFYTNKLYGRITLGLIGGDGDVHFGSSGSGAPINGTQDYGFYCAYNAYRDSDGHWKHSRTNTVIATKFSGGHHQSGFKWSFSNNVGTGNITWSDIMTLSNTGGLTTTRFISTQGTGTAPLTVASTTKVANLNADLLDDLNSTDFVRLTGAISETITGVKTFSSPITSNITTGTAPLTVASTTLVTNLNADLLDGLNSTDFVLANNVISQRNLAWGQSYIDNYRDVILDDGYTYFPNSMAQRVGLLKELNVLNSCSIMIGASGTKLNLLPAVKGLPLDFTRTGTATYTDENGVVQTAISGEPRINYDANNEESILVEPQSTNLFLRSEEFDNAYWVKADVTINTDGVASPISSKISDIVIEGVGAAQHRVSKTQTLTSGMPYTISVFVKRGVGERQFSLNSTNGGARVYYDLTLGTVATVVSGTGTITDVGNGWFLVTATGTTTNTSVTHFMQMTNGTNQGSETYTGDGVSSVYLIGAQLEALPYATSYIPTVASTVTRVAETVSKTGLSSYINSSEGVLFVEMASLKQTIASLSEFIQISDGTGNNEINIGFGTSSTNNFRIGIRYSGVSNFNNYPVSNITNFNKIALLYSPTSTKIAINGTIVASLSGGVFSGILQRLSFSIYNETLPLYGKIKQLKVYTTALSDAQLISLTK